MFLINCLVLLDQNSLRMFELEQRVEQKTKWTHENVVAIFGEEWFGRLKKRIKKKMEERRTKDQIDALWNDFGVDIENLLKQGLLEDKQLRWEEVLAFICPGTTVGHRNGHSCDRVERAFRGLHEDLFRE
jgi:hypothetical protein